MKRAWALLALLLLSCASALPAPIRDELAVTARDEPGALTIVFFTDFQCPHCRRTHAALAPLLAQRRGKVRLVLRHVPLPRHPDARTAARAEVCFETIVRTRGKTPAAEIDEYTHALMTAPDLSEGACEELAEQHGVARDALRRCLSEPTTDARIERDLAMFDAIGGDGVPLLFIGRNRLEGAQSSAALESAIAEAAP